MSEEEMTDLELAADLYSTDLEDGARWEDQFEAFIAGAKWLEKEIRNHIAHKRLVGFTDDKCLQHGDKIYYELGNYIKALTKEKDEE